MNDVPWTRRAALLGIGGGVLAGVARAATGADAPAETPAPSARRREPLVFENRSFYTADGMFDEAAAKRAYFRLCRWFGYPIHDNLRNNLFVTDFALGRFVEVGLGCLVWVDELKGNYCSLEIFLLPGQMIPEHWHVAVEDQGVAPKLESWIVRYGKTFTYGEGEPTATLSVSIAESEKPFVTVRCEKPLSVGEVTGIAKPMEKHWQLAGPEGCILTEVSTYHAPAAVRFTNPKIKF